MRIGELARRSGVGVETVRFYERKGLIAQPARPNGGGFRSYSKQTAERIRFIRQAQDLGFSLREVKELLSLQSDPAAECEHIREQARAKLDEVNQKIARLMAIRGALEDLIEACPGQGVVARRCTILKTLGTES